MAIAVMDTLRPERGMRITDDVSVAGYDDVPLAAWSCYDNTSVRQPTHRMVEATVRIQLDRIVDGRREPQRVTLEGSLVVRGSASKPKGWDAT